MAGRYLVDLDMQDVLVVDLEYLGHQPDADGVRLARIPIDLNPHRMLSFVLAAGRRGGRLWI